MKHIRSRIYPASIGWGLPRRVLTIHPSTGKMCALLPSCPGLRETQLWSPLWGIPSESSGAQARGCSPASP